MLVLGLDVALLMVLLVHFVFVQVHLLRLRVAVANGAGSRIEIHLIGRDGFETKARRLQTHLDGGFGHALKGIAASLCGWAFSHEVA